MGTKLKLNARGIPWGWSHPSATALKSIRMPPRTSFHCFYLLIFLLILKKKYWCCWITEYSVHLCEYRLYWWGIQSPFTHSLKISASYSGSLEARAVHTSVTTLGNLESLLHQACVFWGTEGEQTTQRSSRWTLTLLLWGGEVKRVTTICHKTVLSLA